MSSKDEEELAQSKRSIALAKKYKRLFESKDGKDVLADLSLVAGVANDPFYPGQPDQTAYILGMQRLIKRITSFLAMDDIHHLRVVKDYEVKINE